MTITTWTISSVAAALFGFSKAGIAGTGMLAIPLMASLFGANAAGPVMALYLLLMNVDKKTFIGTTAWFFFVVNLCKVPFSASLNLITASTLLFNLKLIPALVVGIAAGLLFVAKISQTWFERIITVLVVLGGVNLILR